MTRFRYAALTSVGKTRTGLVEAGTSEEAVRALAERGEIATRITRARNHEGQSRIRRKDLGDFLSDLAALRDAGVPLRRALDVLAGGASSLQAAQLARLMADRLDAGSDFGRAARMSASGDLVLAAELVRAGEASGNLSDALRFGADLMRRQSDYARRLTTALAYPAFLGCLSIGALVALAAFAGPAIAPLLEDAPDSSSGLRLVLAAGESLQRHGVVIAAALVALGAGTVIAARREPLRSWLAALRMRLPLIGLVVRDINCGAYARTLGALLAGGAPASAAMDLAAATAANPHWRRRFLKAGEALRDGRTVAGALATVAGAPRELVRLARVGEASGALGPMLGRAGDLVVDRALRRLDQAAAAAGPVLILVMGGFTGWLMSAFLTGLSQLGEGVL